jgi:hypothetical protein
MSLHQSHRSGLNRRPLHSKQTATSHFPYSSEAVEGGRLSTEDAPNQPPRMQRRATMAELYARVRRWFHDRLNSGPGYLIEQERRRVIRFGGRDMTDRELDLTYRRLRNEGLVR